MLGAIAAVAAAPVLRLCLGRWPHADERRLFTAGFVLGEAVLPPALRGLHAVPAAREQIGKLALLDMLREGAIARPSHRVSSGRISMADGNPLNAWRGPPLSFLHFEKAAGTALIEAVAANFHPWQIDVDPERGTAPHLLSAFQPGAADVITRKGLVWGHYDLPALRRLGPERTVITLLREPRDRILSLYYFWRSVQPRLLANGAVNFNVAAAHEHDLLGFLRCRDPLLRPYVDNVYVRRLTGRYVGEVSAPMLEEATRALATCEVVGTLEHIGAFLTRLREIGLRVPSNLPSRNTAEGNATAAPHLYRPVAREPMTRAITVELDRLTRFDEVIFRQACVRSTPIARSVVGDRPGLGAAIAASERNIVA